MSADDSCQLRAKPLKHLVVPHGLNFGEIDAEHTANTVPAEDTTAFSSS